MKILCVHFMFRKIQNIDEHSSNSLNVFYNACPEQ